MDDVGAPRRAATAFIDRHVKALEARSGKMGHKRQEEQRAERLGVQDKQHRRRQGWPRAASWGRTPSSAGLLGGATDGWSDKLAMAQAAA